MIDFFFVRNFGPARLKIFILISTIVVKNKFLLCHYSNLSFILFRSLENYKTVESSFDMHTTISNFKICIFETSLKRNIHQI